MLLGFNTNFRHRGVLFHVQTEDSGRSNPHVITHLFHGGNILSSEKREYSEKLDLQDLEGEVKALMEAQHKLMLRRLKAGVHDSVIIQRMGPNFFKEEAPGETTMSPLVTGVEGSGPDEAPTGPPGGTTEPTEIQPPPAAAAAETPRESIARAFGEGVVSQKPLDEVVLEYLVESARKRKRSSK